MTTTTETRTASLAQRQAKWKRDYRRAAESTDKARTTRDTAIVNYFRSLPDSEVTKKKNPKTGMTTTSTKAVSDNQRAKDTLLALAVGVDDKGKTTDVFALAPQRVVQIVKAYRRMDAMLATSTNTGQVAPELESEEATALSAALLEAAKSNNLGDKGADALAQTLADKAPEAVTPESLRDAEAEVRSAIAKAKAAKPEDTDAPESEGPRPVVAISDALDTLESALSDGAADLDQHQRAMLANRLESLLKHLK